MDPLRSRLEERKQANAFRKLKLTEGMIDLCSNDYLGIATRNMLHASQNSLYSSGSGGSRLLSGNYPLVEDAENRIAAFHEATAGLIFNSGYDANVGLLSCLGQKGDTYLYDQLSHASIRDGMRLSFARSFSFRHNDLQDLEGRLKRASGNVYVITESVFSMDGDLAPLKEMAELCESYGAHLIVDEAHATGVIGQKGEGLVQSLGLAERCFARLHTFGKALGTHGAIVLGAATLRDYLVNFSRAFIYTTALPPASVHTIQASYELFPSMHNERKHLQQLIALFQESSIGFEKLRSNTAIQGVVVPGNDQVRALAERIAAQGLDVRPILYPTVPAGSERLRIVLHSFNTEGQVAQLLELLH